MNTREQVIAVAERLEQLVGVVHPQEVCELVAKLRAAVEPIEGEREAVALVRWHPKHGYNWTSIHFGDVWSEIEGWHDVPLYREALK